MCCTCGSGIILSYLYKIAGPGIYIATDRNPDACAMAKSTFKKNNVPCICKYIFVVVV